MSEKVTSAQSHKRTIISYRLKNCDWISKKKTYEIICISTACQPLRMLHYLFIFHLLIYFYLCAAFLSWKQMRSTWNFNGVFPVVLIRAATFVGNQHKNLQLSLLLLLLLLFTTARHPLRPTFGLERCSDAVCTMPLRAPQRTLDELTLGNCDASTTQAQFLFVKKP